MDKSDINELNINKSDEKVIFSVSKDYIECKKSYDIVYISSETETTITLRHYDKKLTTINKSEININNEIDNQIIK